MAVRKFVLLLPLALLVFFTMGQTYEPDTYVVGVGSYAAKSVGPVESVTILITSQYGGGTACDGLPGAPDVTHQSQEAMKWHWVYRTEPDSNCKWNQTGNDIIYTKSQTDGSLPIAAQTYAFIRFDLSPLDSLGVATIDSAFLWVRAKSNESTGGNFFAVLDTLGSHMAWTTGTACNGGEYERGNASWNYARTNDGDSLTWDHGNFYAGLDEIDDWGDFGIPTGSVTISWSINDWLKLDATGPVQLYERGGIENAGFVLGGDWANNALSFHCGAGATVQNPILVIYARKTPPRNLAWGGGLPPVIFMTDDGRQINLSIADTVEAHGYTYTLALPDSFVKVSGSADYLDSTEIATHITPNGHPISYHSRKHLYTDGASLFSMCSLDSLIDECIIDTISNRLNIPAADITTFTSPGGQHSLQSDSLLAAMGYLGNRAIGKGILQVTMAEYPGRVQADTNMYFSWDGTINLFSLARIGPTNIWGDSTRTKYEMAEIFSDNLHESMANGNCALIYFVHWRGDSANEFNLDQIGYFIDIADSFGLPWMTFPEALEYYRRPAFHERCDPPAGTYALTAGQDSSMGIWWRKR